MNSIDVCAFYGCTGLIGQLIIPNTVTSIGSQAFQYCNGLTSIALGTSVSSIGDYAFSDCNGLTHVVVQAENPPIGTGLLPTNIPVYVPCSSVNSYQTADDWSNFSNIIGMCSTGMITVMATDGGTAMGSGIYESGTLCTVTATANENYCFMFWTENDNVVSYLTEYSFIVTSDCTMPLWMFCATP